MQSTLKRYSLCAWNLTGALRVYLVNPAPCRRAFYARKVREPQACGVWERSLILGGMRKGLASSHFLESEELSQCSGRIETLGTFAQGHAAGKRPGPRQEVPEMTRWRGAPEAAGRTGSPHPASGAHARAERRWARGAGSPGPAAPRARAHATLPRPARGVREAGRGPFALRARSRRPPKPRPASPHPPALRRSLGHEGPRGRGRALT